MEQKKVKPFRIKCYYEPCKKKINLGVNGCFCCEDHKNKYWADEDAKMSPEMRRKRENYFNNKAKSSSIK